MSEMIKYVKNGAARRVTKRTAQRKSGAHAIEIAKIFGFESVEALNADWLLFIKEGKFK